MPVILDVTKQEQIDQAVQTVQQELARRGNAPLVGLVNNAGVRERWMERWVDRWGRL